MKPLWCLVRYASYIPLYFSGVFITGAGEVCIITTMNVYDAWNFMSEEDAKFGFYMLGMPIELKVEQHMIQI